MYDHNEKAGNPGDVIKHTALIAAADVIMQNNNQSFQYADTFAGYAYNPIRSKGEWQNGIGNISQANIKPSNSAVRFWQSLWQCDEGLPGSVYPGSSTFIRKLCIKNHLSFNATLWDISPTVISQLMQVYGPDEVEIHPRSATLCDFYSVKPDLLLVDPPDLEMIDALLPFFSVAAQVIMWLPILINNGEETHLSKRSFEVCIQTGLPIISVYWPATGKMCGCRLVFKLPVAESNALKNAVFDVADLTGWAVKAE